MRKINYYSSLEDVKNLLNKFGLLKNYYFIDKPISDDFAKRCKREDYITIYKSALEKNDYHLLLFDDSFLQFDLLEQNKPMLRYSYYQFPFNFPTYEEYLTSINQDFNVVGDEYKEEYEQALLYAPIKDTLLSIRYDYSEKEYAPGIHSVSHFHIGHGSSMRISCSIFISPLLFVIFIIKSVYFKEWKLLMKDKDFLKYYEKIKEKCEEIEDSFFNEIDKYELYLK